MDDPDSIQSSLNSTDTSRLLKELKALKNLNELDTSGSGAYNYIILITT